MVQQHIAEVQLPASGATAKAFEATRSQARLNWLNAFGIVLGHSVALLAFFPWFWTPGCFLAAFLGLYFFGLFGISLGYHRLLTHRSFECPKWLERSLVTLGICCVQDSPANWVAVHRRHHHHSDRPDDPHSPCSGFFWAHIGWIFKAEYPTQRWELVERYAQDVMRDPYYAWLERYYRWLLIILASLLAIFGLAVSVALLLGFGTADSLHVGLNYFVWAAGVRTVAVWHITFSVNSVTHRWGYRNYETNDDSRNNIIVGFLTNGEGWHNNHHAEPNVAQFRRHWWEVDMSFATIRLLRVLGLAKNVALPTKPIEQPAGSIG
jgi:fatty-acid desaturase